MKKFLLAGMFLIGMFSVIQSVCAQVQQGNCIITFSGIGKPYNISDNGKWMVSCDVGGNGSKTYLVNLDTKDVIDFMLPESPMAYGFDVSDDGIVVGQANNTLPAYWTTKKECFFLPYPKEAKEGSAKSITPDGKYIVGYCSKGMTEGGIIPLLWTKQSDGTYLYQVLDSPQTDMFGKVAVGAKPLLISSDGSTIIGIMLDNDFYEAPIIWQNRGKMTYFGMEHLLENEKLYGAICEPYALTSDGNNLLGSFYDGGITTNFVYEIGQDKMTLYSDIEDALITYLSSNKRISFWSSPAGTLNRTCTVWVDGEDRGKLEDYLKENCGFDIMQTDDGYSLDASGTITAWSADEKSFIGIGIATGVGIITYFMKLADNPSTGIDLNESFGQLPLVKAEEGHISISGMSSNARLTVTDLSGRQVYAAVVNTAAKIGVEKGQLYFIKVEFGSFTHIEKVMVQ